MHTGRKKWKLKAKPEVTTQSLATRLICYVSFSPDLCRTASEHPLHRQLARVVKVLKYTQIWPQCKYKHWQLHLFLTVLLYLQQFYNHLKILKNFFFRWNSCWLMFVDLSVNLSRLCRLMSSPGWHSVRKWIPLSTNNSKQHWDTCKLTWSDEVHWGFLNEIETWKTGSSVSTKPITTKIMQNV